MMSDAIRWYDQNVSDVSRRYESVAAETVHGWLVDLLPIAPALVLDVGAGTGRDAAWLASRGLEVVAVEPSGAMRAEAQRLHASPSIRWIRDSLPSLDQVLRLGLSFDLILLSAVWMHVPPTDRTCLPAIWLPSSSQAAAWQLPCAMGQWSSSAAFTPSHRLKSKVLCGRTELSSKKQLTVKMSSDAVRSTGHSLRFAFQMTEAVRPLLRHIILNDDKSSTYKLALLRALCRIADGASGISRYRGWSCCHPAWPG